MIPNLGLRLIVAGVLFSGLAFLMHWLDIRSRR